MRYERSTRHIARSGYDHFQINLNATGDTHIESGRLSAVFRRGDIGILDIALDSSFASDATFNRAFRREFGIPPGEMRALACSPNARERRGRDEKAGDDRRLIVRWIRQLAPATVPG